MSFRHPSLDARATGRRRRRRILIEAEPTALAAGPEATATQGRPEASVYRSPKPKHSSVRRLRAARHRRGATLVEGALVLGTLLTLILGMFDLSAAVHRHNMLSEAARRGAREAMVHGQQAAPARDVWGPTEESAPASASSGIAETVRPLLVGMQPQDVTITLQWPDGSNKAPNRVRCHITTVYRPVSPFVIGAEIHLSATSTMPIAN